MVSLSSRSVATRPLSAYPRGLLNLDANLGLECPGWDSNPHDPCGPGGFKFAKWLSGNAGTFADQRVRPTARAWNAMSCVEYQLCRWVRWERDGISPIGAGPSHHRPISPPPPPRTKRPLVGWRWDDSDSDAARAHHRIRPSTQLCCDCSVRDRVPVQGAPDRRLGERVGGRPQHRISLRLGSSVRVVLSTCPL